ncbi:DUF4383 domain-containing protein [Saccharomonospora halophila]|uniref:DUF4383 domain-containing protein n=1 Tax=Saccharomonospora halophila TaxID=129922 RepID=UPI0003645612|nr:DUF4383 domain-containing protein [Saccharomonospora halophila]
MTTFPVGDGGPRPTVSMLRAVTLVIGLWYLTFGLLGFVTTSNSMGADPSRSVWVFGVSALVNLGHTGVGVMGVLAARAEETTRAFGWLAFFGFTGLTAYGILAVTVSPLGNLANVYAANVVLYGVSAVLGLLLCLLPVQPESRAGPRD